MKDKIFMKKDGEVIINPYELCNGELIVNPDTLCIERPTLTLNPVKSFCLDVDKISSLEDVKIILRAMQIVVHDNCENFDDIKYLLKEPE
ncbi:hypothetical protein [Paraclostridium bifermentans]|uniref:hypothetical protein n=1 Tax=Paraclostridium bifermentans TaxID=1490 RepID=UPI001FF42838|nr:hypothetical protein [Paraclostridium bifermentans]UOW66873.1 hypothetical protein MTR78_09950 [Paraclostridium bifermentans]